MVVQRDGVKNVSVGVIVMHQSVLIVQMTYVIIVVVRKMKFKHENYVIDLDDTSKAKLYFKKQLIFIGDGYKAIMTMLRGSEDKEPVKKQFKSQLNMREKPKFSTTNDELEKLRREAQASIVKTPEKKKRR